MKRPMASTSIRLEGTQEQINEALLRLRLVFSLTEPKIYPGRDNPDIKLCYLRAYTYDKEILSNLLNYCQQDNQRLQEDVGRMSFEIDRLNKLLAMYRSSRNKHEHNHPPEN